MKSDRLFAADCTRLPELTLASDCARLARTAARPNVPRRAYRARPSAPAAPPSPRLRVLATRIATWFFAARQRVLQRRALSALSDHLLRDAGATRDDVMHRTFIRGPRD
jgi:uncharacterized protein YjiS (DUF1127 family)